MAQVELASGVGATPRVTLPVVRGVRRRAVPSPYMLLMNRIDPCPLARVVPSRRQSDSPAPRPAGACVIRSHSASFPMEATPGWHTDHLSSMTTRNILVAGKSNPCRSLILKGLCDLHFSRIRQTRSNTDTHHGPHRNRGMPRYTAMLTTGHTCLSWRPAVAQLLVAANRRRPLLD